MIDTAIQSANALGETLGFRVMAISEGDAGIPQWLLDEPYGVAGEWIGGTFWPDVRDATFIEEHARLIQALGDRFTVPADLAPGTYRLDVTLADTAGTAPATDPLPPLQLGIEGRGEDGLYALSEVVVE